MLTTGDLNGGKKKKKRVHALIGGLVCTPAPVQNGIAPFLPLKRESFCVTCRWGPDWVGLSLVPSEHEPKGKEVLRFQKTDGRKAGLISNV